MVKHTQTIGQLLPTNCLSVFSHFVGLALKGLKCSDLPEYIFEELGLVFPVMSPLKQEVN